MRLFLVWDSEAISEEKDTVVEDLFEAVEEDSNSEESRGKRKRKKTTKKEASSSKSSESDSGSSEKASYKLTLAHFVVSLLHT